MRWLRLPVLLLCLTAALSAASVYTDRASFLAALLPGYDQETFDELPYGLLPTSEPFGNGTYTYTASSTAALWAGDISSRSRFLGNYLIEYPLTVTFGSGVTAVGGLFGSTDIYDQFVTGSLTLTLSDGTVVHINTGLDYGFVGFISRTSITSLTITGTQMIAMDDLAVGGGVPEPASAAIAAAGCAAILLLRRRRTA